MEVDRGTVAVAVTGGAGTSRGRVDLGKEEGDDHGRRGRWWAEHAGRAPEGGGGPSLRSLPEKLGGEGLDLGRRRLSVAALAVSLEPWLLSLTPGGVERFPRETTRVGQGYLPNESVQTSRLISPARSGPCFSRPGNKRGSLRDPVQPNEA